MKKTLITVIHIFEGVVILSLIYSIWLLADAIPGILLGLYILAGIPLIATGLFAITGFLQHLILNEKK